MQLENDRPFRTFCLGSLFGPSVMPTCRGPDIARLISITDQATSKKIRKDLSGRGFPKHDVGLVAYRYWHGVPLMVRLCKTGSSPTPSYSSR